MYEWISALSIKFEIADGHGLSYLKVNDKCQW